MSKIMTKIALALASLIFFYSCKHDVKKQNGKIITIHSRYFPTDTFDIVDGHIYGIENFKNGDTVILEIRKLRDDFCGETDTRYTVLSVSGDYKDEIRDVTINSHELGSADCYGKLSLMYWRSIIKLDEH